MDLPHPTPTQTPTLFCFKGDLYFSGYENQLDGKVWIFTQNLNVLELKLHKMLVRSNILCVKGTLTKL